MSGGIVLTTVKVAFQLRFDRIPLSAFPQLFGIGVHLGQSGNMRSKSLYGSNDFLKVYDMIFFEKQ